MMRNKVFGDVPMKDKRIFQFTPRIIRSMESDCWGKDGLSHAELESADKVYTDHYLATAAGHWFDSIWVHVVLRETVPSGLATKSKAPNSRHSKVVTAPSWVSEETMTTGVGCRVMM